MGYTTKFIGAISIDPPLNSEEIKYLKNFSNTRRMDRKSGPYFVDATGLYGQEHTSDVINFNSPPLGQPGLWCKFEPYKKGTQIKWNGQEKFYDAEEWMRYLIEHFVGLNPIAKQLNLDEFKFLQGHTLNGILKALGEESIDRWFLIVENNNVFRLEKNDYKKYLLKQNLDNKLNSDSDLKQDKFSNVKK